MAATVFSALFVPPSKAYWGYLDLRVLCLLLSLMLVVAGLQKVGMFGIAIERLLKLVHIIVLQTVAANLGSMLTPLGNPQNLYLYSLSNMTTRQFIEVMAVPWAISLLILAAMVLLIKSEPVNALTDASVETAGAKKALPWIILFLVCLLAVLRIIPYSLALVSVITGVIIFDRPMLSQVISNVPAAMLLSNFTSNLATFQNWISILSSGLYKITGHFNLSVLSANLAPFLFVPFGRKAIHSSNQI